ncbi:MAG: ATP-binding protein [Bacillota bacterium]
MGIRAQLTLLVAAIFLPLTALQTYTLSVDYSQATARELKVNEELAGAIGSTFDLFIHSLWNQGLAVGTLMAQQDLSPAEIEQLFAVERAAHPSIESLFWADLTGRIIAGDDPRARGLSVGDRPYVQAVMNGAERSVSDLITSRLTGNLTFALAIPVHVNGRRIGILGMTVSPQELDRIFNLQRRSTQGSFGLVDRSGYVVYLHGGPDLPYEQRRLAANSPAWRALRGERVIMQGTERADQPRIGSIIPLPKIGWAVFATTNLEALRGPALAQLVHSLSLVALAGLVSLLAAMGLAGELIRRISGLGAAARSVMEGTYEIRLPVENRDDEVGLARIAFNQMADRILHTEEQLRRQIKQQAAIVWLGQKVLTHHDVDKVLQEAAQTVGQTLGADLAMIRAVSPENGSFVVQTVCGQLPDSFVKPGTTGPINALLAHALASEAPVLIDDLPPDSPLRSVEVLHDLGLVNGALVAIRPYGQPTHLLCAYSLATRRFLPSDIQFLQGVANVVTAALERAELEQIRITRDLSAKILSAFDSPMEAVPRLLQILCERFRWDRGIFWRVHGEGEQLEPWATWGDGGETQPGAPEEVLRSREPLWVKDGGLGTLVAIPVLAASSVRGVVVLSSRSGRVHNQLQRETMETVCRYLAQYLERAETSEELYTSRDRLRALVDASPLPIVMIEQKRVVAWNPAAEWLLGWTRAEVLGQPIPPELQLDESDRRRAGELLAAHRSVTDLNFRLVRRDGKSIDVRMAIAPTYDQRGELKGYVAVAADVTNRTRFLQVAAHELRNPMAGIKGLLSLLRRRYTTGKPLGDLVQTTQIMEREIDRLSTLFNEILEAFQVQEGRLRLNPAPVDMNTIVAAAAASFGGALHPIHLSLPPEATLIYGDDQRLEEVVRNLINNAVKYSPTGSPIELAVSAGKGRVQLTVRDRGIGIAADSLNRVFEPFYRGKNFGGKDPGGIGLGLFICRDIVQRHSGQIWVESQPGRGSTFYVTLPPYKRGEADGSDSGA